jgi:hypothetical protein
MTSSIALLRMLERALAFAHGALEDPTPERVGLAKAASEQAMSRLSRIEKLQLTLTDAKEVLELTEHLRTVVALLERTSVHSVPAAPALTRRVA